MSRVNKLRRQYQNVHQSRIRGFGDHSSRNGTYPILHELPTPASTIQRRCQQR